MMIPPLFGSSSALVSRAVALKRHPFQWRSFLLRRRQQQQQQQQQQHQGRRYYYHQNFALREVVTQTMEINMTTSRQQFQQLQGTGKVVAAAAAAAAAAVATGLLLFLIPPQSSASASSASRLLQSNDSKDDNVDGSRLLSYHRPLLERFIVPAFNNDTTKAVTTTAAPKDGQRNHNKAAAIFASSFPTVLSSSFWVPPKNVASCETRDDSNRNDAKQRDDGNDGSKITIHTLSWRHRLKQLVWPRNNYRFNLPMPRRLQRNDPALQVSSRLIRQRARDEMRLAKLQQEMAVAVQTNRDTAKAQAIVTQIYDTLYGIPSPQLRQYFLERYGCTAWNEAILKRLVDLGQGRGFCEIGAGHGQWARALEDARREAHNQKIIKEKRQVLPHPQTFVRAYDDASQLPLNPQVYHARTVPAAQFFGTVRPCPNLEATLAAFENRNRILLLVYPPPDSDLAVQAVRAYTQVSPDTHDTVVYVGEGRGGANANEAFFDLLENTCANNAGAVINASSADHKVVDDEDLAEQQDYEWILLDLLPGVPCGTKGEECVYIFQRRKRQDNNKK